MDLVVENDISVYPNTLGGVLPKKSTLVVGLDKNDLLI